MAQKPAGTAALELKARHPAGKGLAGAKGGPAWHRVHLEAVAASRVEGPGAPKGGGRAPLAERLRAAGGALLVEGAGTPGLAPPPDGEALVAFRLRPVAGRGAGVHVDEEGGPAGGAAAGNPEDTALDTVLSGGASAAETGSGGSGGTGPHGVDAPLEAGVAGGADTAEDGNPGGLAASVDGSVAAAGGYQADPPEGTAHAGPAQAATGGASELGDASGFAPGSQEGPGLQPGQRGGGLATALDQTQEAGGEALQSPNPRDGSPAAAMRQPAQGGSSPGQPAVAATEGPGADGPAAPVGADPSVMAAFGVDAAGVRDTRGLGGADPAVGIAEAGTAAGDLADDIVEITVPLREGGGQEALLHLRPEHLGRMWVRLSVERGRVNLYVLTERDAAGALLTSQLPLLREALDQHGLRLEQVRVETGLPEPGSFGSALGHGAMGRGAADPWAASSQGGPSDGHIPGQAAPEEEGAGWPPAGSASGPLGGFGVDLRA